MPLIPVESSNFPATHYPQLRGIEQCQCTWAQLTWAAVTVGRKRLRHVLQHGQYSLFELVYRSAILWANLQEQDNGHIGRSEAYDGLDPSEKGAISYFLGLTASKLPAEMYLDVPWLMHLDVYRNQLQLNLRGRSRPDLLGQDSQGNWIVIESKGRTNGFDASALRSAKQQARQIGRVNGIQPNARIALLTHFSGGHWQVTWQDPEPSENEQNKIKDINITDRDLISEYYSPFVAFFTDHLEELNRRTILNEPYLIFRSPSNDLSLGMAERIVALDDAPDNQVHADIFESRSFAENRGFTGPDGLLIELGYSWAPENMRLQPQERQRRP